MQQNSEAAVLLLGATATTSISRPNWKQQHYRVVQLNLTPEIEVFHMLFERPLSIFTCGSWVAIQLAKIFA